MHEFTLWAPYAKKLAVKVDDTLYPMSGPDDRGWWKVVVEAAEFGADYGFVLDEDGTAYPDPRGAWQPYGVHGLSRLYDQRAFAWSDDRWQGPPLAGAVMYEMHVGTFTQGGTFDAAIEPALEFRLVPEPLSTNNLLSQRTCPPTIEWPTCMCFLRPVGPRPLGLSAWRLPRRASPPWPPIFRVFAGLWSMASLIDRIASVYRDSGIPTTVR